MSSETPYLLSIQLFQDEIRKSLFTNHKVPVQLAVEQILFLLTKAFVISLLLGHLKINIMSSDSACGL